MRSPIERLVDKVCGVTEADLKTENERFVNLRCPDCGTEKRVLREKDEDPNAKVIELRCPKCWDKPPRPTK